MILSFLLWISTDGIAESSAFVYGCRGFSNNSFDDALSAMYKVGTSLPAELRETALGGIAITPTGIKLKNQVFGSN